MGSKITFKTYLAFTLLLPILAAGFFVSSIPVKGKENYRVGLVLGVGGRGDKSFNDSAYHGLKWAMEGSDKYEEFDKLPVKATVTEPSSGYREDSLRLMADRGLDLIISVGFLFSEPATKVARRFPEIQFAVVDYHPPSGNIPSNLKGLSFPEHKGSFLAGAIAAMKTRTKKIGFIGGLDIPLIRKFEAGFKAGAWYLNPNLDISTKYIGTTGEAFINPAKGKEIARAMYSNNVDVIYHAAGLSGLGVIEAAGETGNFAIGVDSDQNYMAPGHVLIK